METDQLRTKTVGCKLTEGEHARLQQVAQERKQSLGEWCREVLLERTSRQRWTVAERTLLAEVLGLRTILLNLFFKLANGEPITVEEMHRLIERADGGKLAKARVRIEEAEKILREGEVQ
jgi:hypothetical protein